MSNVPDSKVCDSLGSFFGSFYGRIVHLGGARYGEELWGEVCLKVVEQGQRTLTC